MLRTCRAAVAVLLIGGIGLTVPPQTKDMLAFLDDGQVWPAISFQISLAVLGISAWYWSRAALAARFGVDDHKRGDSGESRFDRFAFTWLPRAILFVAFAVGAVIAISGADYWTFAGAVGSGLVMLLLAKYRPRRKTAGPIAAPRYTFAGWLCGGAWTRFHTLLRRGPWGILPAAFLLALGVAPLLLAAVEQIWGPFHFANWLAGMFPGPGVAVLLLGLMIGPLVATTFVFDGLTFRRRLGPVRLELRRPPVVSILLLYVFVAVPAIFHVHPVRMKEGQLWPRQPLDAAFTDWVSHCAPGDGPVEPVIVAISGGATRAGLWGAAVLDQVLRAQRAGGPSLFAISSVSGGSLGAAAAVTLLSQGAAPACRAAGLDKLRPMADQPVPLAGDALGPLLGGWLLQDIPRAFFEPIGSLLRAVTGSKVRGGGDSADAIEHGFAVLWGEMGDASQWDQPYLSLFYTDSARSYRSGMPLWFANGTDAGTGNRVITSPIEAPSEDDQKPPPWPFRGARDFHRLMKGDVSIATAINNTARFPYLEPFGEMVPADGGKAVGSLVDGGYFENEGLQTALDLAAWLMENPPPGRPVQPIIVQATGDGEVDTRAADVMTCSAPSDGAYKADDKHGAWQILAPLVGLYHVRGGHSAVLLRQAHDMFCPNHFMHFYLPARDENNPVPLNWILSNRMACFIWTAFTTGAVNNGIELQRLQRALEAASPAAAVAAAQAAKLPPDQVACK